jgi:hypothetical protein
MRTVLRSYEPVFGGIVAVLAAAFLCFVLTRPGRPDGGAMRLAAGSVAGISWGMLQVAGYRNARRKHIALEEPTLGTAVGCVFIGLMLALLTVCLYEFAQNTLYTVATGFVAALLLCVGAVVGIRQGIWK